MIWHDPEIEKSSYMRLPWVILAFLVFLYLEYLCLNGLVILVNFKDKLFAGITGIGTFLYLFNLIGILFDGPRIIKTIYIKDNLIETVNSMKNKNVFDFSQLVGINFNKFKWFMKLPPGVFKSKKPYFSIHFSNGNSYAISPHMERIDELKNQLLKIIESNKAG